MGPARRETGRSAHKADLLFKTVDDFAEGEPQADDITCVAIRFDPKGQNEGIPPGGTPSSANGSEAD